MAETHARAPDAARVEPLEYIGRLAVAVEEAGPLPQECTMALLRVAACAEWYMRVCHVDEDLTPGFQAATNALRSAFALLVAAPLPPGSLQEGSGTRDSDGGSGNG